MTAVVCVDVGGWWFGCAWRRMVEEGMAERARFSCHSFGDRIPVSSVLKKSL